MQDSTGHCMPHDKLKQHKEQVDKYMSEGLAPVQALMMTNLDFEIKERINQTNKADFYEKRSIDLENKLRMSFFYYDQEKRENEQLRTQMCHMESLLSVWPLAYEKQKDVIEQLTAKLRSFELSQNTTPVGIGHSCETYATSLIKLKNFEENNAFFVDTDESMQIHGSCENTLPCDGSSFLA